MNPIGRVLSFVTGYAPGVAKRATAGVTRPSRRFMTGPQLVEAARQAPSVSHRSVRLSHRGLEAEGLYQMGASVAGGIDSTIGGAVTTARYGVAGAGYSAFGVRHAWNATFHTSMGRGALKATGLFAGAGVLGVMSDALGNLDSEAQRRMNMSAGMKSILSTGATLGSFWLGFRGARAGSIGVAKSMQRKWPKQFGRIAAKVTPGKMVIPQINVDPKGVARHGAGTYQKVTVSKGRSSLSDRVGSVFNFPGKIAGKVLFFGGRELLKAGKGAAISPFTYGNVAWQSARGAVGGFLKSPGKTSRILRGGRHGLSAGMEAFGNMTHPWSGAFGIGMAGGLGGTFMMEGTKNRLGNRPMMKTTSIGRFNSFAPNIALEAHKGNRRVMR